MTPDTRTPVAQRNERCPATAEDAGSIPAGRIDIASLARRSRRRAGGDSMRIRPRKARCRERRERPAEPGSARRELVAAKARCADVAHREEQRSATPKRPVRAGPSALEDPWCNGSTPSSNLGGPGSIPGESVLDIVVGRSVSVISWTEGQNGPAVSTPPPDSHTTTTTTSAAGRNGTVIDYESTGRGFESRPELQVAAGGASGVVRGRRSPLGGAGLRMSRRLR
jgi:hypothetical protein